MKIRNDLAKNVVMDFINETFSKFEFNPTNVLNSFVAKMFINNNFDKLLSVIATDGYISLDALEQYAISDAERLGKFEVPGIGTKYLFTSEDVKHLISKMREHAE